MTLIERLRQVVGETTRYYVNPDGPEAAKEIERLREALKPFADVVKGNWDEQPDTMPMSYGFGVDKRFDLTLGDFRKARAALNGDE